MNMKKNYITRDLSLHVREVEIFTIVVDFHTGVYNINPSTLDVLHTTLNFAELDHDRFHISWKETLYLFLILRHYRPVQPM